MTILNDFVHRELYPSLFDRVGDVFPEMRFRHYRGGWASALKLDGTPSHDGRKDKTIISPKCTERALEQGGDSVDLVTLYMQLHGHQKPMEAIKAIADILGISVPPMIDNGEYRAYIERQNKLEALAKRMASDLQAESGTATLDYLKNVRGYEQDFIEHAEFGHVTPDTARELHEALRYTNRHGEEVGLPYGVGSSYTLAIPYRSGGRLQGFNFRATLTADELKTRGMSKYKNCFFSARANKRYNLFGLMGFNLSGDRETDKTIVVVEGEIDALRASYAGVKNVVATGGNNLSDEAIKEAKSRGVKRVILLFDTDGGDTPEEVRKKQQANNEKVKTALEIIHGQGLAAFVCQLQPDQWGKKQDVDSYLRTHSGEQLQATIAAATTAPLWLFEQIYNAAIERQGDNSDGCAAQILHELKIQTFGLCNSVFISPTDRDTILYELADRTGGYITKESLQEEADTLKAAEDLARQNSETTTLCAEALRLSQSGKADEALALMADKLPKVKSITREGDFARLLALPTAEGIRARRKESPTGVSTGYSFRHGDEDEELLLPSGALTYICAPTSHGKSRMLQNLALNLATDGTEGTTLYFSYEESQTDVEAELLNIYANVELSANNLRTLRAYYSKGDTSKIKGMAARDENERRAAEANLSTFKAREAQFDTLLTSGKLRVYYKDYDSGELIEAIRYIARQTKVRAVFIDYIQLLHKSGSRLQRKDELKTICADLMCLAVDTKLPIVLGAQLNREAYSPLDMAVQNIAEASDIEHSANIVLLLWNSRVKPIPQKSSYYINKQGDLTKEAAALEGKGFEIGKEGKLYATLAKHRGGARGLEAIFDFCGTTGKITPSNKKQEAAQAELSLKTSKPTDESGYRLPF